MARARYDEVTLLTGMPSFRASRMLARVLSSEPRTLVYALVRADELRAAEQAIEALPKRARDRVVFLEGDPVAMDLGLSGAELRRLAGEVDRIHHVAQAGYHSGDRVEAERLNVRGTHEILEVARLCTRLRCLVYHSTAWVSGDRTGVVREPDLDPHATFRSAALETRARGEKIVRSAMDRLPIAVVRPATIVGDSTTGEIDGFDGPYLLVLLIVTSPAEIAIPLPARGDAPLNVVPIDYVVAAAHAIGRAPSAIGRTFHLADPSPLPARQIFELVARVAGRRSPRGYIPSNLTKALLRAPGLDRFAKSPRAFVEQLATPVRFDTSNADDVLAGTGISCPPFESYVEPIVDFVRRRVEERRERALADVEIHDPLD